MKKNPTQSSQDGFTLIEIIISITVIGIISAIALPAYQKYVVESRRAEAQAFMSELALRQERWRANSPSYGTTSEINANTDTLNFYNFSVENISGTTYTIIGTPQGSQDSADASSNCKPLTLTETGVRGPAGCWKN